MEGCSVPDHEAELLGNLVGCKSLRILPLRNMGFTFSDSLKSLRLQVKMFSRFLPRPQQGRPSLIQLRPETPEELRKRLQEMSDLELRRFGERGRKLSDPKMNFGATEQHVVELEEARAEWRRRHPASPARRNHQTA